MVEHDMCGSWKCIDVIAVLILTLPIWGCLFICCVVFLTFCIKIWIFILLDCLLLCRKKRKTSRVPVAQVVEPDPTKEYPVGIVILDTV